MRARVLFQVRNVQAFTIHILTPWLVSLHQFSAVSSCPAACAFNRLMGAAQGRHHDRLCRFVSLVAVGVIDKAWAAD